MSWYYADAGRQIGPIEEAALDDLVRTGVVRDDTLVWSEGMANWQPHSAVRGPKPAPMPAVPIAANSSFCSECGRPFPADQLVAIGSASVCAQCKPLYLQRIREGGQAIGVRRYAGFWIRFVAMFIDGIILAVIQAILFIPLGFLGIGLGSLSNLGDATGIAALIAAEGVLILVTFVLQFAYYVYFWSSRGATPGKMALGLKIIRADGGPLSIGLAIGRYFCFLLDVFTFYIGFIIAGFDSEKRALHDRICDTRVIYTK
ncbi:MAG TPA: RDD family protein [Bryobacteraceae bacterium]|nr:RDD family protein [Bryobacteraceae bacterium]